MITTLSWQWAVALGAVTVLNIATFAPPWMVALPGLPFVSALAVTQASTALSIVVPGGAAAGIAGSYAMLRAWAFPPRSIARAVTLTSLWNQFANLAYPIVAVFLLSVSGGETAVLATAAFIGVAILGVAVAALTLVLFSDQMARDIGDLAARLTSWAKASSAARRSRGPGRASSASGKTRSTCSSAAGTRSRQPPSPGASASSSCSSSACARSTFPRRR